MFFFFKQKTAYEMRISDWSSDVCSSDLLCLLLMASLAGWSVHASSKTLRMLSGWDKSYPGVEMTEFYAAKLKEASDGALTIRRSGPEAVPPFEQLEPVSAGIFDQIGRAHV